MVARAEAHEAAKVYYGVTGMTRDLIDHQMIDFADLFAARIINFGAHYVFAGDQIELGMGSGGSHFLAPMKEEGKWGRVPPSTAQKCDRPKRYLLGRLRARTAIERFCVSSRRVSGRTRRPGSFSTA